MKPSTCLVDAEVLADVEDPAAEASSSARLGLDVAGVETWVDNVVLLHLHSGRSQNQPENFQSPALHSGTPIIYNCIKSLHCARLLIHSRVRKVHVMTIEAA